MTDLSGPSQRLDRWFHCARLFKTRALAARVIEGKGVRVTRAGRTDRTDKANFGIRVGDTVAFVKAKRVIVVTVLALADRRGPAPDAATLYDDITESSVSAPRDLSSP